MKSCDGGSGLVYGLMDPHDFVIDPLPNLLFTRDSSLWVRDHAAVTSLAMPARARETTLTQAIYRYHPLFAGTPLLYQPGLEHLEGGDVLLLAPGVIAVGVGERTTAAGAERIARQSIRAASWPTPSSRFRSHRSGPPCTWTRSAPWSTSTRSSCIPTSPIRWSRSRYGPVTTGTSPPIDGPEPFLLAAAKAMGLDQLRVIDTGLDPVTAEREQWDDGNNTLAIAPRVAVAYERNVETNAQLERAGIEVIRIPGSELGSGRGGPRCMSCPVTRQPLPG